MIDKALMLVDKALLIIISYGGGTNSKAILVGMKERGIVPYAIIFCDTKAERPITYKDIEETSKWCVSIGFPPITIISNEKPSRHGGLENYCIVGNRLPSIAYGFKTCSLMYKKEPFDDWIKANGITNYVRYVGFDADESRRAKDFEGVVYPLIEWDWGRDDCVDAIERAGLPQPGKSACYFCPSSKKSEVIQLRKEYPELAARAIEIERNAELTHIKGLGRSYSWADLYKSADDQFELFPESRIDIDCGCYDG